MSSIEPDLFPIIPSLYLLSLHLSDGALSPADKATLVAHSLRKACTFGDLSLLQYLCNDHNAQAYLDLSATDEDGVGLITLTIHGFGARDSDRDVEREECVRLLVSQGCDIGAVDNEGWTPLHHASLFSPPTLISHLLTHGCSQFALTRRKLTALDIVTAHSVLPGREDVALLLEESMRSEGWTGGRMEARRRLLEQREKRRGKQRRVREDVAKVLALDHTWWGHDSESSDESGSDEEEDETYESVYTPPANFETMLVFAPRNLPHIFHSLITNYPPEAGNSEPANTLYLLARFACLTCDHTWLEELIVGAADAIEDAFFSRAEDVTCLVFWLYNTTIWLHLMQCDNAINEACEMLGSFELMEEVINSVFVFIIRYAERRIDQLLDSTLLEHAPLLSEFESVHFESEWSFLRPFSAKKKAPPPAISTPARGTVGTSPPSRPTSPSPMQSATIASSTSQRFSSLRQTFARSRAPSATTPLQSLFAPDAQAPTASPNDLVSFLTALHTLLTLSNVNPALTTQLWSQVMYWTSCEIFNRILTRKKYLCRSRAIQIGMNVSVLEEWVMEMGLPQGVQSHFYPVKDLLSWLQCLSSISDFSNLIATLQTMKNINPLQMRRAVRDYKYEINEGRMTEECNQYLAQMQKDWERHRVKLGVQALRKEIGERDRDREESVASSYMNDSSSGIAHSISTDSNSSSISAAQYSVDLLFERSREKSAWEPARAPQVLGELLDSRFMLPLLFPSDPRLLAALPGKRRPKLEERDSRSESRAEETRSASRASEGRFGAMQWRSRNKKLRDIGPGSFAVG